MTLAGLAVRDQKYGNRKLNESLRKTQVVLFLVLVVACGVISGDRLLAQLAFLLPTYSLLWNLHPHVSISITNN